jgi:hypothetical protein
MLFTYALAPHGRTLATRPLGKELRADLARRAFDEDAVELDFSGVVSTSHSFADEFVARLAEEIDAGEVGFEATVSGLSAEVERVVRKAMERRGVELPIPA